MIIYGNAVSKIKFKYEIGRNVVNETEEEEYMNPETGEMETEVKDKKVNEYVR
jgi:hypothetical protein